MKLTVTQVNHVMKQLRHTAKDTVDTILPQIKEAMVPPKINKEVLTKYLNRLAYDKPQRLVNICLRWAQGVEPAFLSRQRKRRDLCFQQYNAMVQTIRDQVTKLLLQVETELLWKDDWGTEYPEFLNDELVASIVDFINGDSTDGATENFGHEVDL